MSLSVLKEQAHGVTDTVLYWPVPFVFQCCLHEEGNLAWQGCASLCYRKPLMKRGLGQLETPIREPGKKKQMVREVALTRLCVLKCCHAQLTAAWLCMPQGHSLRITSCMVSIRYQMSRQGNMLLCLGQGRKQPPTLNSCTSRDTQQSPR